MRHFLLFYEFAPGYAVRRHLFRSQHLERAWAASARGDLVLAGALCEPMDTGLLLFKAASAATAEAFARADPYVINGLVLRWRVREWATTVGEGAMNPAGASSAPGMGGPG